jgi:DNA-binding response OmpR family regulator
MDRAVPGRGRITVVDDHADFLEVVREILSEEHDVVAFSGHDITMDDIIDSRPDLMMVDLRLDRSQLQGLDILTQARAHPTLSGVPVIICSADVHGLGRRVDAVLDAGNTALLAKPFTVDSLEEVVTQGLTRGFPRAVLPSITAGDYHGLFVDSADAILVADSTGRYVDANDVALSLLGMTRDELRGRPVADLVAEDHAWTDTEWHRYRQAGWWHGSVTLSLPGNRTRRMLATARVVELEDAAAYISWLKPLENGAAASQ